jgi:hypothetical protein
MNQITKAYVDPDKGWGQDGDWILSDSAVLLGIPEMMTHVLDYIDFRTMLIIFSTKQLEYFWTYLSDAAKKKFLETSFIGAFENPDPLAVIGRNRYLVSPLINYFHFVNRNWKFFVQPYVSVFERQWTLTISQKVVKSTRNRLEMKNYLTSKIHDYLLGFLKVLADCGKTAEDSILFGDFIMSIRNIIGGRNFTLIRRLMGPSLVHVESSLHYVYDNEEVFNKRIGFLKKFDYNLRRGTHPVFYCRHFYLDRHVPLILDYVNGLGKEVTEVNAKADSSLINYYSRLMSGSIQSICSYVFIHSMNVEKEEFSMYFWKWGCRCGNHYNVVNELVTSRYPKQHQMTHTEAFERQKKLAKFCQNVVSVGKTPVSREIYLMMFEHGCRCSNHTRPLH